MTTPEDSFARTHRRRVRVPAVGGEPPVAFARALEARPSRLGFNLDDVTVPWPKDAPWQGGTRLRRFRGRIEDVDEGGDVVVRLGEIPSGRVLVAVLPAAWFIEAGLSSRRDSPFALATWTDSEGGERRALIDEGGAEGG